MVLFSRNMGSGRESLLRSGRESLLRSEVVEVERSSLSGPFVSRRRLSGEGCTRRVDTESCSLKLSVKTLF